LNYILFIQGKLAREGMKPVYKSSEDPDWKPIPGLLDKVPSKDDDDNYNVSFKFEFVPTIKEYWFAYCYPFSYEENQVNFLTLFYVN